MMRCVQDNMRNILMWVTIYDPFASNPGIDQNWNRIDYPWIFIVPSLFFLYVESLLCKPKFSLFSDINCIHIVNSADSEHWKWSSTHDNAWSIANFAAESENNRIPWK